MNWPKRIVLGLLLSAVPSAPAVAQTCSGIQASGSITAGHSGAWVDKCRLADSGVTLTTGGSVSSFLNAAGTYSPLVTGVSSVFGRAGAVTAQTGDYSFGQISGTVNLSSQASGTLQAAQAPAYTGDATSSAGGLALALATVNSSPGTYGTSSQSPQLTIDGKGRVTAVSNVTITPAAIGAPTTTGTGASGTWGIAVTGNAGTVTNGVYTTGSYLNPAWITGIPYSILTGAVPTWNQNTTGNAATATALASVPTQCAGGLFSTGVAASGNANCANPSASGFVVGPGSSTGGYVPLWNNTTGTLLQAGLPVGTSGNSTIVETNSGGTIASGIVPTLNQNTTGTAANVTASSNSTLTTLSVLSLPYSQLTGAPATGVSSVFTRAGAVTAQSGDYNTSQVTENTNLYFTNARAIASTLTGYISGAGVISAADSILSAIQKLNGNIAALVTGVSSVAGTSGQIVVSPTTGNVVVSLPATITQAENFTGGLQSGSANVLTANQSITWTGSGDVSGSASGTTAISPALTLATVNLNTGSVGSSTAIPVITLDGKGRATAATTAAVIAPVSTLSGAGTGVATALGDNVGSAGAFVVNGGALGTPSSGVGTNLTGITLGTSAAATNPQRSGQPGTGLFSDTTNVVEIGGASTETAAFVGTASGVDYAQIQGSATGSPGSVTISGQGTDSNVSINLLPKGSGVVESPTFNSVQTVMQPLASSGLLTTASGSANSTALNSQISALQTLGQTTLATEFGVNGVSIPQGVYTMSSGLTSQPWIKLQTAGDVELNWSAASSPTAATNATTSTSSAVLHFASTPTSAVLAAIVTDTTNPSYLPANTIVTATGTGTVTMSNNPTTTIGNGDVIAFSMIGLNVNNDNAPANSFTNNLNAANTAPFLDTHNGSLFMNGPGETSNSIGIMLGSGAVSPNANANVRGLQAGPISVQNFYTCLRLNPHSLYMLHLTQGGQLARCTHSLDTATFATNVNSGEGLVLSGGFEFVDSTVGNYFDAGGMDTDIDNGHFDYDTYAIQMTVNDIYDIHVYNEPHFEYLTQILKADTTYSPYQNQRWVLIHDAKFTSDAGSGSAAPTTLFTGSAYVGIDNMQVAGYSSSSNNPANLFMFDSHVSLIGNPHILYTNYAQLTSFSLLQNDDPCFAQGTNGNNLVSAPMSTYYVSSISGVTATVTNSPVWTTGQCATSLSQSFAYSAGSNYAVTQTDRFPVQPGDHLIADVVFQTNKATSTANLQLQFIYTYCNASIAATNDGGTYGDVIGTDQPSANTWSKMANLRSSIIPNGVCYAQLSTTVSNLASGETVVIGFEGVNKE